MQDKKPVTVYVPSNETLEESNFYVKEWGLNPTITAKKVEAIILTLEEWAEIQDRIKALQMQVENLKAN